MGFARERVGADGRVRYTAVYRDLKGRLRSAGTFSQRRVAARAWQRAGAKVAQGYLGDPGRGRQTFRAYVENTWLPNHLKNGGVQPPTIRYCFIVLSAIFTTALNDQVTSLHPCKGVDQEYRRFKLRRALAQARRLPGHAGPMRPRGRPSAASHTGTSPPLPGDDQPG